MWTIALSLLIGFGVGTALVELFDIGDDDSDTTEPEALPTQEPNLDLLDPDPEDVTPVDPDVEPDPVTEIDSDTGAILVNNGGTTTNGTGDDDAFSLRDEAYEENTSVLGGAGNDTMDFGDPSGDPVDFASPRALSRAFLSGGAGDDIIIAGANSSLIDGGDGNDLIDISIAGNSIITGGTGDDEIIVRALSQDTAFVDGGEGNDLIDGRGTDNAVLTGGEGNDTILVTGHNQPGAGYNIVPNGGAGDDILRYDGEANTNENLSSQTITGGEGRDTFEIRFNEGGIVTSPETEGQLRLEVVNIDDFDADTDTLLITPYVADTNFTIASASLLATESGQTELTLHYEADTGLDRDVVITINGTGLQWGDITFAEGTQPAVLDPIP